MAINHSERRQVQRRSLGQYRYLLTTSLRLEVDTPILQASNEEDTDEAKNTWILWFDGNLLQDTCESQELHRAVVLEHCGVCSPPVYSYPSHWVLKSSLSIAPANDFPYR